MFLTCLLGINLSAYSQTNNVRTVTLEIRNVTANSGTLHISISRSVASYKSQRPDTTFQIAPTSTVVKRVIELPTGDCVVNVYQDINNNGKADTGFLGIPKEPVGITNWNGRGPPGNFNKHKITINETTTSVVVDLYQL